MAEKQLIFDEEARTSLMRGVDKLVPSGHRMAVLASHDRLAIFAARSVPDNHTSSKDGRLPYLSAQSIRGEPVEP